MQDKKTWNAVKVDLLIIVCCVYFDKIKQNKKTVLQH